MNICRTKGFSLFEVLIALFILSLGLLSIADLTTISLRRNYAAYLHSVADNKLAAKIEKTQGFTLIEILLSITLGLILMAGISQVYLSVKKSYKTEQNIARFQENARFASFYLMHNIRMAGYGGCRRANLKNGMQIFHSNNLPDYLQGQVTPGTDVIIIKKADTNITHLINDITSQTNKFKVEQNPATTTNPNLLISDCKHSDAIITSTFGSEFITSNKAISNYQKADTEIGGLTETAYFISGNPPGLYTITNQRRKDELVSGITNMQIKYTPTHVNILLTLTEQGKTITWPIYIALRE